MSAPAWNQKSKAKAKKEGLPLVKLFIQAKHHKGGSYGCSGAMGIDEAMLLAAIFNRVSAQEEIPDEVYTALGVERTKKKETEGGREW